jgi:hypothetical protein
MIFRGRASILPGQVYAAGGGLANLNDAEFTSRLRMSGGCGVKATLVI